MYRTNGRPMARGTIGVHSALALSWILIGSSFALATHLGVIPLILLIEGAGSYIFLYTIILKRRTSMNVFFTAPSVAAPAWFGWYLGGAPLYPVGITMGIIVAIWGPLHLWSIAFTYSKDYERVGVPMFPSLVPENKAIKGILSVLGFLIGFSYILSIWANSGIYIIGVTILNIFLVLAGLKLYKTRTKKASWALFKYTSPYIVLVFSLFLLIFIIK
jgi:protoheme IX farnesyltransferase